MMTETWADGRVALITGATSGFGEALARRFGNGAFSGQGQALVVTAQA